MEKYFAPLSIRKTPLEVASSQKKEKFIWNSVGCVDKCLMFEVIREIAFEHSKIIIDEKYVGSTGVAIGVLVSFGYLFTDNLALLSDKPVPNRACVQVVMAGLSRDGQGPIVGKLESQIYCIKYTLFCFNVVLWLFGLSIFALCLWICVEPGFNEWMKILELQKFFIGIYIILIGTLGIMVVAFLGCGSALMENIKLLYMYIASQLGLFVFGLVGACVLLDFSTYDSSIQPIIKDVLVRLINNPMHEGSREILRMVQEGIGCCGADGPMDYLNLNKPLPSECRDSVTGNAYFHGCVDELTWYLEGRTGWLAGIVLASCMICIVNSVMSLVLIQAVKKEEEEAIAYKN